MKKMLLLVANTIGCLSYGGLANAADYIVDVCAVQVHSNSNTAYISRCSDQVSRNNCSDGAWIGWDMSVGQGQAMYSAAMVALTAGKKVVVRFDGSTCISGHDATQMIRVTK